MIYWLYWEYTSASYIHSCAYIYIYIYIHLSDEFGREMKSMYSCSFSYVGGRLHCGREGGPVF